MMWVEWVRAGKDGGVSGPWGWQRLRLDVKCVSRSIDGSSSASLVLISISVLIVSTFRNQSLLSPVQGPMIIESRSSVSCVHSNARPFFSLSLSLRFILVLMLHCGLSLPCMAIWFFFLVSRADARIPSPGPEFRSTSIELTPSHHYLRTRLHNRILLLFLVFFVVLW